MIEFFKNFPLLTQVFIATTFAGIMTSLGASLVLFFKKVNRTLMDSMLAFAAGVMIASSFWSLLVPGIEKTEGSGLSGMITIVFGFLFGGVLLLVSDIGISQLINKKGLKSDLTKFKRNFLLISSVTIHNVLEGLCIGVAFTLFHHEHSESALLGAVMLSLGIGIQNFSEGAALSLALRGGKMSRNKAFILGSLSGVVEPLSGVLGFILVKKLENSLPFLLALAAGTMIYVVVSELIPESQTNKNKKLISMVTLLGFTIMMILEMTFR